MRRLREDFKNYLAGNLNSRRLQNLLFIQRNQFNINPDNTGSKLTDQYQFKQLEITCAAS